MLNAERLDQALSPCHLLANIVHPKYRGKSLTDAQYETAMDWATAEHENIIPDLINFKAEAGPFPKFLFKDNVVQTVKPVDWWMSHTDRLHADTSKVVLQLLTATASSAGVERVFSSFGLVHSNLRNRLGIEKAGKLVFLFKLLNKRPFNVEDASQE